MSHDSSLPTPPEFYAPNPDQEYSLEQVAELVPVSRRWIAIYCRHGLVTPLKPVAEEGWSFDEDAIRLLRRAEYLRTVHGLNVAAIRLVFDLLEEVERLQRELRFRRGG